MERWDAVEALWRMEAEHGLAGMRVWRQQQPKATLREIEAAADEHLAALRKRVLEDTARTSRAADLEPKAWGTDP